MIIMLQVRRCLQLKYSVFFTNASDKFSCLRQCWFSFSGTKFFIEFLNLQISFLETFCWFIFNGDVKLLLKKPESKLQNHSAIVIVVNNNFLQQDISRWLQILLYLKCYMPYLYFLQITKVPDCINS